MLYKNLYVTYQGSFAQLNGRGRTKTGACILRRVTGDRDDESNQCIQGSRAERDKEGDKFFTNLEDRDKETDVPSGSLQTIETGSLF
jgi:hypothetical protein